MNFSNMLRAFTIHSVSLRSLSMAAVVARCGDATKKRTWIATLFLFCFSLSATGCGNTLYLVQVHRAEQSFQEAKELGAERIAPYEYYSAKLRLEKAKKEAANAEYGNAADLSDEATDFSNQAIKIAKTQGPSVGNSQ